MTIDWKPQKRGDGYSADAGNATVGKNIRLELWSCTAGYRFKVYYRGVMVHVEEFPFREAGAQQLAKVSADKSFHDFCARAVQDFTLPE